MASALEQALTSDGNPNYEPSVNIESNFKPLSGKEITYNDRPNVESWSLPPIRKISQTRGTLIWQIAFDPTNSHLIRRHGFEITPSGEPGSIRDDTVQIVTNQSGLNVQGQALLQAKKLYLDKTREGYSLGGISSDHMMQAQLACTYRPENLEGKKRSNERLIDVKEFMRAPVAVQVKIDGQRARIILNADGKIEMISRKNVPIKWHDHIREELMVFFLYIPEGVGLDGELIGSGIFEDTSSKIRQKHAKHEDNEDIKFYIFDLIVPEVTLEDRIATLYKAFEKYRQDHVNQHFFILTHSYARSHEEIDSLLKQSLDRGYEGLTIRFFAGTNPNRSQLQKSWYRGGRNASLLKYKLFDDEEGTIIDIIDGKDSFRGMAVMVLKDPRGNILNCVSHGDESTKRSIYQNRDKYINKLYTYKYFGLTKYGIPRFPVGVRFRTYE